MKLDPRASRQYTTNAALLAAVRKRAGLSLRDLARATGVPYCTIWRCERGEDVSARSYVALMRWVAANQPNIAA